MWSQGLASLAWEQLHAIDGAAAEAARSAAVEWSSGRCRGRARGIRALVPVLPLTLYVWLLLFHL